MNDDIEQMVTQSEVAKLKDMSLQLLAYHLGKPDAPRHEVRYGRKVYRLTDIDNWQPSRDQRENKKAIKKNTRKGVTAGKTAN